MTFKLLVQDLPAGYAAAARRDGEITVIVVDRSCVTAAHERGDCEWGVNIVNSLSEALDHDPAGLRLVV